MKELRRNTIENLNKENAAGNVMLELNEADLNNFSAGAGEPRDSSGMTCTLTAECNVGTIIFLCC